MTGGRLLGNRIRELREARRLTQEDLAKPLGMSARQVLRYEKGEVSAPGEAVAALAIALNTTADYLLGLTDDPNPRLIDADLSAEERDLIVALRNGQTAKAIRTFAGLSKDAD